MLHQSLLCDVVQLALQFHRGVFILDEVVARCALLSDLTVTLELIFLLLSLFGIKLRELQSEMLCNFLVHLSHWGLNDPEVHVRKLLGDFQVVLSRDNN